MPDFTPAFIIGALITLLGLAVKIWFDVRDPKWADVVWRYHSTIPRPFVSFTITNRGRGTAELVVVSMVTTLGSRTRPEDIGSVATHDTLTTFRSAVNDEDVEFGGIVMLAAGAALPLTATVTLRWRSTTFPAWERKRVYRRSFP